MDTLASMVLPDHASAAGAPDTSAGAILPLSAGVPAGHSTARGSHALILQAMAAVLLLACLAAHVAFRRLMAGVERERRRTLRTVSAADLFGQRKREAGREPARKGTPPLPGGAAPAEAGGHPAPETPELLYTPTQDRRSSRDLLEEGEAGEAGAEERRKPLSGPLEDGEGHHRWPGGGEYFGEWRGGQANGRGIFVFPSGVRYEGEWKDGREHGAGTLVETDGSTFYGFWVDGRRHGDGVFKPASGADVLMMREYAHGVLKKESVLRVGRIDVRRKEVKADRALRAEEKRAAAKSQSAAPRPGETIYKGHHSYDLMRNLQLGLIFSIARSAREAPDLARPLADEDFTAQVSQYFPRGEHCASFKWKDYCPAVFARLRASLGVDPKDYLLSLTGDKALRRLPSPGKSGSVFFLSDDDRFMVKTVSHEEALLLLRLLPAYERHCSEHPTTLLTRFYGLHRIKPMARGGAKVRFLVMGNVFPTEVRLHRKYDLKGSTHGRTAGPDALTAPNTILKDLDVDMRLGLSRRAHGALMRQIRSDTGLLAAMGVMDYSLLLGVHFPRWGQTTWYPPSLPQGVTEKAGKAELQPPAAHLDTRKVGPMQEEVLVEHTSHGTARAEFHLSSEGAKVHSSSGTAGRRSSSEEQAACRSSTDSRAAAEPGGAQKGNGGGKGDWGSGSEGREARVSALIERALRDNPSSHVLPNGAAGPGQPPLQQQPDANGGPNQAHGETQLQQALRTASSAGSQLPSPFLEASSVGFDPPPRGVTFTPAGQQRPRSRNGLDLSTTAAQRRASLEMGMGGISHKSLAEPGASGLRAAGRMLSLHSPLRPQLGVAVPAKVLPRVPSAAAAKPEQDPEPVLLFFGIVDFLQQYNLRKKTEHALKSLVMSSSTISVASPAAYAERFCKAAQELFVARTDA